MKTWTLLTGMLLIGATAIAEGKTETLSAPNQKDCVNPKWDPARFSL